MAIVTTSHLLLDGARRVAWSFTGVATDGSSQETLVKKVDAAALSPAGNSHMKLRSIVYSVYGGLIRLYWEGTVPREFLVLNDGSDHTHDYQRYGGLSNDAGAGATGSILLSTQGFSLGSSYTLTIELTKGGVN